MKGECSNMLNIDSLQNGIVIDHITAGTAMVIYDLLELGRLDCCVAIIKNARSEKYGRKDIIKIDGESNVNVDILGFLDPNITWDHPGGDPGGKAQTPDAQNPEKRHSLPQSPLYHQHGRGNRPDFLLSENNKYRCAYCEQEYQPKRK